MSIFLLFRYYYSIFFSCLLRHQVESSPTRSKMAGIYRALKTSAYSTFPQSSIPAFTIPSHPYLSTQFHTTISDSNLLSQSSFSTQSHELLSPYPLTIPNSTNFSLSSHHTFIIIILIVVLVIGLGLIQGPRRRVAHQGIRPTTRLVGEPPNAQSRADVRHEFLVLKKKYWVIVRCVWTD